MTIALYLSEDAGTWLGSCHPQDDVVADVASKFIYRLQKVAELGRLYGKEAGDPIKKLEGFDELWEVRVRHSTGWYRLFFAFAEISGEHSAAFDYGLVKKERNAPRHEYEKADRRVHDYVRRLRADGDLRLRNRARMAR